MATNEQLTIAIVSYNSFSSIQNCLSELIQNTSHPVIVVDNASPDQSGTQIQSAFPSVQLLQMEQNLGYGRAANRAIAAASTPYLLLLNPDLLASAAAVDQLLATALTLGDSAAIIAPAVTTKDHINIGPVAKKWVIGAAMLLKVQALQATGFFDENIFLFSEETDLCFRTRKAGLGIWLDTSIYIEHLYRQSSTPSEQIEALKNWHIGWSHSYYYTKHGLATGKKNPKRVLALYAIKCMTATQKAKRERYKHRLRGTLAFIRGQTAFSENGTPRS